ncbi:MAG: energy transducer TonB [Hydrogenovibrio sp.]|uniref:energy transducer TonB n=1 Tax=Hydrogenovibrio sp. TaxID=2065821 RepID=UPI002870644E|nr:energy transducer TonB [Hydrogenovibrio sp.]MDR9499996.1 energy transducer TonB [Hydrogenovibrio sp.]
MERTFLNDMWRFRVKGGLGMIFGTFAILSAMLYLNSLKPDKPEKKEKRPLSFEVVKNVKTPEKPKPKPKTQPKPQQADVPPPAPIMSGLGVGLSGIDFGMGGGYDVDASADVDEDLLGDTSNAVMTGETVDQKPRPISRPPLEYPARAMAKRIEGFVMLSILINKEGKVTDVKVIESDPQGTFDKAAIDNVKKWTFTPARYKGKPVSIWMNQPISFLVG